MLWTVLALVVLAAEPRREFTVPKSAAAEYGQGLSKDEALAGWISLFDGRTTFGWTAAKTDGDSLSGGATTADFADYLLRAEVARGGQVTLGGKQVAWQPGTVKMKVHRFGRGPIRLDKDVAIRSLAIRPAGLQEKFNGRDFAGWKAITHPRRPDGPHTKWEVREGAIVARGGPGALEMAGSYGDLVIQIEVRTRAPLVNGGLFFRAIEGDFMNGYEAQLFNACYDRDPAKPARYSTGAIDDRQLARRLVSRDKQPFVMTAVATGPHIATWVNGFQTVDWTDRRKKHANPREGLRTKPGVIQLQSHDPGTKIEFRSVRIAEIE